MVVFFEVLDVWLLASDLLLMVAFETLDTLLLPATDFFMLFAPDFLV